MKGRCYINVDKFADNPCEIMKTVKKHNMLDQIVVKCDPIESVLQSVEEVAPDIPYLAIVNDKYDPFAQRLTMLCGHHFLIAEREYGLVREATDISLPEQLL
ncbi:MAG: hypothetical protein IJ011_01740 [Clostridia bacterium]|nr:hypothetical protein [Clostridia bacterium]